MAYHPQTDGQSEQSNQWLEQYLHFWVNHQQTNWHHYLPLAEFAHNSWKNKTTGQTPFEVLMGYTPRAEIFDVTSLIPKAQKKWAQRKTLDQTFKIGDRVWLEGQNLHLDCPSVKLSPKRHGPFKIKKVLSLITYQLDLSIQWKIHDVFHIDLLTPYQETDFHGLNFVQPPPNLIDREEEYEVEQILDARQHGRGRKVQYLIKWKGYPNSDNQWVNWDDLHAEEVLEDFRKRQPDGPIHIRRANGGDKTTDLLMTSHGDSSPPLAPSQEDSRLPPEIAEAFLSW